MNARHHCFNCGADIGPKNSFSDRRDDCGAIKCVREARNVFEEEREEARYQVERNMEWF
jgi:hypothetical protein